MIKYIREQLSQEELLCQLAEEASELAQAALKLRRTMSSSNPTPVSYEEALENLHEEIADVQLLLEVLDLGGYVAHARIREEKLNRWTNRLKEARQED